MPQCEHCTKSVNSLQLTQCPQCKEQTRKTDSCNAHEKEELDNHASQSTFQTFSLEECLERWNLQDDEIILDRKESKPTAYDQRNANYNNERHYSRYLGKSKQAPQASTSNAMSEK